MTDRRKFHFISGLPRSGSTLLSACFRQNPKIEAGMTSAVGSITGALRNLMTQSAEIDALVDDDIRLRILRSVFDGYYSEIDRPTIIDTNRGWSSRIPELKALFPEVKIVAMVRDPAWIVDSLELITRRNPLRQSSMVKPGASLDQRIAGYMGPDGMVGRPMRALKEGMHGADAQSIMVVEYDAFCADPKTVMEAIYNFLGEEPFDHDFSNVTYTQEQFDAALRTPDLHTVSGAVEQKERKTILPPDLFQSCSSAAFWHGEMQTQSMRIVMS